MDTSILKVNGYGLELMKNNIFTKSFIISAMLFCCLGLPVMATPYTDYCETAINYIINTLGLSDEYLYNNQIDVSVSIMPDGSVKDVYIRNGLSRLVKWENKVLDIKFPSHNLMEGIGGGPDVYVSQRLIRKSYLAKMEHEEFLYILRQCVKAGFGYYDKTNRYSAKVTYTVDNRGRLRNYKIVQSSGNSAFDNAVLKHLDKRQESTIMYFPESKGNTVTDTMTFSNK